MGAVRRTSHAYTKLPQIPTNTSPRPNAAQTTARQTQVLRRATTDAHDVSFMFLMPTLMSRLFRCSPASWSDCRRFRPHTRPLLSSALEAPSTCYGIHMRPPNCAM